MVCCISSERILHEAIFIIRLDTCCTPHNCNPVILDYSGNNINFCKNINSFHPEYCYIKIYDNNISLFLTFQNLFEGLIWFILPIMMIIINDVMAYMFGFFLGRTPLIKLSPKKTWEGYLGGGVRPLNIYYINI